MPLAVGQDLVCEGLLELTAPIGLGEGHIAAEVPAHGLFQEGTPIGGSEGWRQKDVRLFRIDVDARECKQASPGIPTLGGL